MNKTNKSSIFGLDTRLFLRLTLTTHRDVNKRSLLFLTKQSKNQKNKTLSTVVRIGYFCIPGEFSRLGTILAQE